jgi:hypothetical protein
MGNSNHFQKSSMRYPNSSVLLLNLTISGAPGHRNDSKGQTAEWAQLPALVSCPPCWDWETPESSVPTVLRGAHIDRRGHCFGLRIKSRALEKVNDCDSERWSRSGNVVIINIVVCTKLAAFASPAALVDGEAGIICLHRSIQL